MTALERHSLVELTDAEVSALLKARVPLVVRRIRAQRDPYSDFVPSLGSLGGGYSGERTLYRRED